MHPPPPTPVLNITVTGSHVFTGSIPVAFNLNIALLLQLPFDSSLLVVAQRSMAQLTAVGIALQNMLAMKNMYNSAVAGITRAF